MSRKPHIPSAETIESERQILDLRRAGMSLIDIAGELNLAKSTVSTRYKAALTRTLKAPAAEVRDLEADRLDRLQAAVWSKALRGDLPAVDRVLRIMERRAELFGLDHKHGIAERTLQLEADKVRLMAIAVGRVFDSLELTEEQRTIGMRVLLEELRAADEDDEHGVDPGEAEPDVVPGEVTS